MDRRGRRTASAAAAPTACPASASSRASGSRSTAVRDAFATDVLLRRDPGELYALRHGIPLGGEQSRPVEGWVERLDPETLEVVATTPRLPGGRYWPGGLAAHANGDLHMIFGRWAHRLSPGLDVLASHRLPVARPAQLVRRSSTAASSC